MRYHVLLIAAGWVVGLALAAGGPVRAGAQETVETPASLLEGLARREGMIRDLRGCLLDRAWLTPWYAAVRAPQVRVTVIGPTTAGRPAPPEQADGLYGAYFGRFVIAPAYCRCDVAALQRGDENLWGQSSVTGGQVSMSAGIGALGGEQPGQGQRPALPERFVLLRQDGRIKTQRAEGPVTMALEMTAPTLELAIQQSPLADLLFGQARPTLAQSLQAAQAAARATGGAGEPPPEEMTVAGPTEHAGREQYRLVWRDQGGAQWVVWLCPAWGYAPTQLVQRATPAPEDRLPVNTERVVRRWEFSGFVQLADDLWLPQKVLFAEYLYSAETPQQHPPLARVHELTLYDLAANTDPDREPLPTPSWAQYPDLLAALVGYYPELAEKQAWLEELVREAADSKRPEVPEEVSVGSVSISRDE